MRNAIFISAGIGNALLLVPLIKVLREQGGLTAISTSPFSAEGVFDGFEDELFDDVLPMSSTVDWMKQISSFKQRFNTAYLDHFAAGRKNILFASSHSKELITNTIPRKLPSLFQRRLKFVKPIVGLHEASQYLRFVNPDFDDSLLNEELFRLVPKPSTYNSIRPYITFQPSSGNNSAPWKTLPIDKWNQVIEEVARRHENHDILILGDASEEGLLDHLITGENILKMVGKTSLSELPGIIGGAKIHVGNDSGLMHIAGCVGTPTITVWGGSDPSLYGWHKINADKHITIHKPLPCGPCSRWLSPNNSRIHNPSRCPDFACIQSIDAQEIVSAIDYLLGK